MLIFQKEHKICSWFAHLEKKLRNNSVRQSFQLADSELHTGLVIKTFKYNFENTWLSSTLDWLKKNTLNRKSKILGQLHFLTNNRYTIGKSRSFLGNQEDLATTIMHEYWLQKTQIIKFN